MISFIKQLEHTFANMYIINGLPFATFTKEKNKIELNNKHNKYPVEFRLSKEEYKFLREKSLRKEIVTLDDFLNFRKGEK